MKISIPSFLQGGPRGAAETNIRETEFVIALPHASGRFPVWADGERELDDREEHERLDIGSRDLGLDLASMTGASLISARYTRLLIDMNRDASDPSAIARIASGISDGDLAARLREHADYHADIEASIADIENEGRRPVLVDLHSFTRTLGEDVRSVDIGVVSSRQGDEAAGYLFQALRETSPRMRVRPEGVSKPRRVQIRRNEPYSGDHPGAFTGRKYGENGKTVITIEVCNDLLLSQRKRRQVSRLIAGALHELGHVLATRKPEQVAA